MPITVSVHQLLVAVLLVLGASSALLVLALSFGLAWQGRIGRKR